ncbi:hypothetical protein [Lactococcus garvieae]|uniref:hypothetical protein n=1 Tax=Lactococcus garvieae TaxID=1363 RepID=UPI0013FDF151|nr:hypothetical protein [Lactococcus garvieae]NHI69017.1 hypothetical protein [Lactococcus garvieae]NHJ07575.1 hypothetical protein [Lactococcus garvieae]
MELEKQVQQHEDKLKQHDKELSRLNDFTVEMQKSMNEGLTRVDESNRFLREQNTRQSEQNAEILQAVIKRNEHSEERQNRLDELETKQNFQLKMLDKTNFWKVVFGVGGAAGAVFAIIMELIKYFGGR